MCRRCALFRSACLAAAGKVPPQSPLSLDSSTEGGGSAAWAGAPRARNSSRCTCRRAAVEYISARGCCSCCGSDNSFNRKDFVNRYGGSHSAGAIAVACAPVATTPHGGISPLAAVAARWTEAAATAAARRDIKTVEPSAAQAPAHGTTSNTRVHGETADGETRGRTAAGTNPTRTPGAAASALGAAVSSSVVTKNACGGPFIAVRTTRHTTKIRSTCWSAALAGKDQDDAAGIAPATVAEGTPVATEGESENRIHCKNVLQVVVGKSTQTHGIISWDKSYSYLWNGIRREPTAAERMAAAALRDFSFLDTGAQDAQRRGCLKTLHSRVAEHTCIPFTAAGHTNCRAYRQKPHRVVRLLQRCMQPVIAQHAAFAAAVRPAAALLADLLAAQPHVAPLLLGSPVAGDSSGCKSATLPPTTYSSTAPSSQQNARSTGVEEQEPLLQGKEQQLWSNKQQELLTARDFLLQYYRGRQGLFFLEASNVQTPEAAHEASALTKPVSAAGTLQRAGARPAAAEAARRIVAGAGRTAAAASRAAALARATAGATAAATAAAAAASIEVDVHEGYAYYQRPSPSSADHVVFCRRPLPQSHPRSPPFCCNGSGRSGSASPRRSTSSGSIGTSIASSSARASTTEDGHAGRSKGIASDARGQSTNCNRPSTCGNPRSGARRESSSSGWTCNSNKSSGSSRVGSTSGSTTTCSRGRRPVIANKSNSVGRRPHATHEDRSSEEEDLRRHDNVYTPPPPTLAAVLQQERQLRRAGGSISEARPSMCSSRRASRNRRSSGRRDSNSSSGARDRPTDGAADAASRWTKGGGDEVRFSAVDVLRGEQLLVDVGLLAQPQLRNDVAAASESWEGAPPSHLPPAEPAALKSCSQQARAWTEATVPGAPATARASAAAAVTAEAASARETAKSAASPFPAAAGTGASGECSASAAAGEARVGFVKVSDESRLLAYSVCLDGSSRFFLRFKVLPPPAMPRPVAAAAADYATRAARRDAAGVTAAASWDAAALPRGNAVAAGGSAAVAKRDAAALQEDAAAALYTECEDLPLVTAVGCRDTPLLCGAVGSFEFLAYFKKSRYPLLVTPEHVVDQKQHDVQQHGQPLGQQQQQKQQQTAQAWPPQRAGEQQRAQVVKEQQTEHGKKQQQQQEQSPPLRRHQQQKLVQEQRQDHHPTEKEGQQHEYLEIFSRLKRQQRGAPQGSLRKTRIGFKQEPPPSLSLCVAEVNEGSRARGKAPALLLQQGGDAGGESSNCEAAVVCLYTSLSPHNMRPNQIRRCVMRIQTAKDEAESTSPSFFLPAAATSPCPPSTAAAKAHVSASANSATAGDTGIRAKATPPSSTQPALAATAAAPAGGAGLGAAALGGACVAAADFTAAGVAEDAAAAKWRTLAYQQLKVVEEEVVVDLRDEEKWGDTHAAVNSTRDGSLFILTATSRRRTLTYVIRADAPLDPPLLLADGPPHGVEVFGDRLLFFDVSFFNRLRIYEASRSGLVAAAASGAAARSGAGARPAPSAAASSAAIPAATGSAAVASTPAAHGTSQPPLPAAAVTAAATGSSPTCLPAACQSLLYFGRQQQNSGGNTSSKQSLHIHMRGEALLQPPYDTQPLLRQVCCISPFFFSDLDISAFGVALYGRLPPSRPAVFLLKENRKRVQPRKRHVWHALPSAQHHHRDVQLQWYSTHHRHARQLQQQHRRPRRTQQRRCQQRQINQQQRLKQRRTRQQGGKQPHLQLLRSAASIRPSLCCRHDDRAVDSRVTEEGAASTTRRADDGNMSPLEFSEKHELYVDVDLRRYLPSTIATQPTEAPTHLQLTKVHSKYTNGSQWSVRTPQIWRDTQRLVEHTDWSGRTLQVWAEPQRQMDGMKTHQQGEEKRKQPPQVPFLWKAGTLLPAVNTDFTSPFLLLSIQSVNQPPLQLLLDMRRERLFLPPSEQQDQVLHLRKEAQLQHNCVMKAVQKFLRFASVPGLPSPVSGRRPAVASTGAPHAVFDASRDGTAAAETGGTESTAAANPGASRCTAVTTNTDNVSFPAAAHAAGLHCQMAAAPPSAQEGAGAAAEEPGRVTAAASDDSTYARTTIAYVPSRDGSTAIPVTLLLPAGASSVTVRNPAASLSSLLCEQQRNATPREDGGEVIKSAHASVSSCNGKSSTSMRRTCSRGGTVSMVGGSRRHTGKNITRNPCLFACVHATSPMRFLVLCYGAYKQPQQVGFSPLISLLLTSQAESGRTRACADVDAPATTASVVASCVPWGVVIAHTRGEGAAVSEGLSCGRGARKYEGITDLEDVLQWLLACNLTRRDLLVVKACSAGGILAAALYSLQAMRQYAAAVVLKQPFVDPLTSFISTTIEQQQHRQQHHGRQKHSQRHKRQQQQRQQQLGQRPQQQRQQPEQCEELQQLQKSSRTEPPNVQLPPSAVVQLRQRADEQKTQHQTQVEYHEHTVAQSQQPRHLTRQIEYTRRPQKCSDVPGGAEDCRKRQREMVKFSARPFHLREEKEQNVQPTGEVFSPSCESHQVDTHFQRSEEASRLHMGLEHHHRCEFNDSGSAAEGVAPRECDDVTPECQVAATDELLCAPADALVAIESEEWGNPFAFTSPAASAAACNAACDTAFTAARPENVAGSAFCPALHFEEEMPLFLLSMLSYSAVDNFHPPRCFTPPTLATPAAAKRAEMGLGVPDSAAAIEHDSLCCSRCGSWRCLGSTYCHVEMLRSEETCKDFGESAASTRNSAAARCSHASSRRSSESWKKSTGTLGGFPAAASTATSTFRRREWPHLWLSASVGDTIVGCWQSCGFLMRLQAMDRLLQQKPDGSKTRVHRYQQRVQRHTRQQHFYQQESNQQQQTELQQEVPRGTGYLHKPLKVVQNKELLRPSQQFSNFQIDEEKEEWADHRSNIGACVYFRLDGAYVGHIGSSNYAARLLEDAEEICFLLKATEVESAG